jgi:O-antigen/teichoic acid export membrane protein
MKNLASYLFGGTNRTKVVKKNILGSFTIKGAAILTSLLLVPITIKLLDQEKYGIWITIFSVVSWFNMMDIGIGNGFRNKFAEAVANNDIFLAKKYVNTFYGSMLFISMGMLLLFWVLNPMLNWYIILNLPISFDENIQLIILCTFTLFCFQWYGKSISTVLLALQKTAFSNLLMFLGNLLALMGILVLKSMNQISLFSIALTFMIAPIIVFLFFSIILFSTTLKKFRPSIFYMPLKADLKVLMGLGVKFFVIQITTLIMFSSANIVITQLYGPSEVTPYNITQRLFNAGLTFFAIIVTPFWSAFTEANAKNDVKWIKKSMRMLKLIWGLFAVANIVLCFLAPWVIELWIGGEVTINYGLAFQFGLFAIIMGWNNPYVFYISGVGKIKLELYIAVFQCVITIPLAIYFAKNLNLGVIGVIAATNLVMLIPAIIIPIQYRKLISGTAKGIWNK